MENLSHEATRVVVRKEVKKNPIVVSRVYVGDYQSKGGELQAELKQTVETKSFYPAKTVKNDLQSNPFTQAEFNFEEKDFSQQRTDVTWIIVPKGTDVKTVQDKISMNPNATLYRILSNYPIIHSDQQGYMDSLLDDVSVPLEERKKACEAVIEKIANRQVLRYPEDDDRGHKKGELILDTAGKPQYKACFFSDTAKEDVDNRTAEVEKYFATEAIRKELELYSGSTVLDTQVI